MNLLDRLAGGHIGPPSVDEDATRTNTELVANRQDRQRHGGFLLPLQPSLVSGTDAHDVAAGFPCGNDTSGDRRLSIRIPAAVLPETGAARRRP
jgi:hypothetical protein